ncbi:MAG: SCO family protein [Gammaproteobacteria bacterium]|nr:SCO family protein [Gammaproteobacteria bacterium]
MPLTRNTRKAFIAFLIFDLLLAIWLAYLFLLREEVGDINQLRELGATRYPEPLSVTAFSLTADDGKVFTAENLLDQWSLVFFGFTSCPDVCPLTLEELARFSERYGEMDAEDPLQVVFVTVDPEHDGVTEVAEYMTRFDDGFTGLTGSPEAITALASDFFVHFSTDNETGNHSGHKGGLSSRFDMSSPTREERLISHNSHLSVVNPAGQLHAVIRPPVRSETLLEVFPQLIQDW